MTYLMSYFVTLRQNSGHIGLNSGHIGLNSGHIGQNFGHTSNSCHLSSRASNIAPLGRFCEKYWVWIPALVQNGLAMDIKALIRHEFRFCQPVLVEISFLAVLKFSGLN